MQAEHPRSPAPRARASPPAPTRAIGLIAFEQVASIDIVGPHDVFTLASEVAARRSPGAPPAYTVELLSADGGA